jgi:hypothetical protein
MMGKGNNFVVTIGNNSAFSLFPKRQWTQHQFSVFCDLFKLKTSSQRNEHLFLKQHGLFPVARMPVPKMVKNGFNSVLVVSAVFRVDRYS